MNAIEVTIRDRAAEPRWGSGPGQVVVRKVRIAGDCPCGQPRGPRSWLRQHDDGETYYVEVWTNPCGHVDRYAAVVVESRQYVGTTEAEQP